jgi:hypothetical protein
MNAGTIFVSAQIATNVQVSPTREASSVMRTFRCFLPTNAVLDGEYLDLALPDRLPLENLVHRHGFQPCRLQPVHVADGVLKGWNAGVVHGATLATVRAEVPRRGASRGGKPYQYPMR